MTAPVAQSRGASVSFRANAGRRSLGHLSYPSSMRAIGVMPLQQSDCSCWSPTGGRCYFLRAHIAVKRSRGLSAGHVAIGWCPYCMMRWPSSAMAAQPFVSPSSSCHQPPRNHPVPDPGAVGTLIHPMPLYGFLFLTIPLADWHRRIGPASNWLEL